MATEDISRFLFQPQKRYSSVRMQQGRILLDSDWNEFEHLENEIDRQTLIDIVCAKGTSNNGFFISNINDNAYDFAIANGSFYLGGLRFEAEDPPQTFLTQSDWLQIDVTSDSLPTRPTNLEENDERYDLVYLRGWEQCVTAVEDSELRERALGGPDSTVRIRRMRRVEMLSDVPSTCAEAFAELQQQLTNPDNEDEAIHDFDERSCELQSGARLTVTFNPNNLDEDPCRPEVSSGYLGADNQTIRVQLTAPNRFIWSYDNASPLYRVQVSEIADGENRLITFLTLPRDQEVQPLADQIVEIIPWGAILSNQEKVAEFQGQFFSVATSFNPASNSLTLDESIPQEWLDWLATHSQYYSDRDPGERQQYFYLRLWTGGSGEANQPDIAFSPETLVTLPGTGLSISFSQLGLPGDFWVIAARPNTPDIVVPWDLLNGAPPTGPKIYFAPLALIRWRLDDNGELQASIQDCRDRFQPLCKVQGCCTVTVGDGQTSQGLFNSLADAIAFLPEEGGRVCLLPGLHEANIRLEGKRNITIKGCGKQTRVIPSIEDRAAPIFNIIDSECIALLDMDLATLGGTAILLEGTEVGALKEIEIGHNRILAAQEAINVMQGVAITIHHNRIRMLDREDVGVAIYLMAEDSLIERNEIGVVPAESTPPSDRPEGTPDPTDPCTDCIDLETIYADTFGLIAYIDLIWLASLLFFPSNPYQALGGIQIAGGSERIKVWENKINGGAGNGITLGSSLAAFLEELEEILEEELQSINHNGGELSGFVVSDAQGIGRLAVDSEINNQKIRFVTDESGYFSVGVVEPGEYSFVIATSDYKIERIITQQNSATGSPSYQIEVVEEDADLGDLLAFIYDVEIIRNEISQMGLSGIGFSRFEIPDDLPLNAFTRTVRVFAQFINTIGNPIIDLIIHDNHIFKCSQNPIINQAIRDAVQARGMGGISLGACTNLSIKGNRIEANGISHLNPVCGVFVTYGEQIDIVHNSITENGELINSTAALISGRRGGIVLGASSFPLLSSLSTELNISNPISDLNIIALSGRSAVRLHDNIVSQPAGQALTIFAIGAVSVINNHFNSELSGTEFFDLLAGAVLIFNLGVSNVPGSLELGIVRAATNAIAGITVNNETTFDRNPRSNLLFPKGNTLFNNNQTRLGIQNTSLVSQFIFSLDDIGCDGNQSDDLRLTGFLIPTSDNLETIAFNTVLWATTLRASDNRFQEIFDVGQQRSIRISLLTLSILMNNTSNNQGDHCILPFNATNFPASPFLVSDGNQVLDATLCPEFFSQQRG